MPNLREPDGSYTTLDDLVCGERSDGGRGGAGQMIHEYFLAQLMAGGRRRWSRSSPRSGTPRRRSRETVASVRAQSFADWELILVDDASTDGSRDLARALAAGDPRIRLIERAANGGAAAARNDGIRAARGRLIAFLDADDRWHPEKLARQTAFMAAGGHALVYSAYRRVAADGRRSASSGRRPGSSRDGAAPRQRHRLPDRGLRHARSSARSRCRRCAAARTTASG